jgi:hypothetical protein
MTRRHGLYVPNSAENAPQEFRAPVQPIPDYSPDTYQRERKGPWVPKMGPPLADKEPALPNDPRFEDET